MDATERKVVDAETLVRDGLDRVAEVARFLGMSKSAVYALMARGELAFVKLGKSRRIPKRATIELAARNLMIRPRN
jgi:excisionase family DNA binding protein